MYKKPSNREFRKIFDKFAFQYDKSLNKYSLKRRIDFIKKHVSGKCLEVGAGTGEISKVLIKNFDVIATDISPNMVDQIKDKLKIKTYVSDAEKLPFKNNSFNTIIAAEMIYYLDNPRKFLNETKRILKPGGKLILTSANNTTIVYDWVRMLLRSLGFKSMYFDDKNRKFITFNNINTMMVESGLKPIEIKFGILIPSEKFDGFNKWVEKTILKKLCSFIYIVAQKQ